MLPLQDRRTLLLTALLCLTGCTDQDGSKARMDSHPDTDADTDTVVNAYLLEQQTALSSVYGMQIVPSGTYTIGCTAGQGGDCQDDEHPVHDVTLTQSYLIGETEVTQGLYASVMGSNPSFHTSCGLDCPVEWLTWYDVVAFANALSTKQGLPACYSIDGGDVTMPNGLHCGGFRLPTEAEWEVAARAGQDLKYSGSDDVNDVAWYDDNSNDTTHPIGQKQANGHGLYDMSGNAWEWVWDSYDEHPPSQLEDPATSDGRDRVFRGGSWSVTDSGTRVSIRYSLSAGYRNIVGFRLVLASPSPT